MVLRKITVPYCARFAGVNSPPTAAGLGAVTVKPPLAPTAWIAAMPAAESSFSALVTTSTS